jgi:hypothetical protein
MRLRCGIAVVVAVLSFGAALADSVYVAPSPAPDLSAYARKTDLSNLATSDALSSAIAGAQAAQTAKQGSIPTAGPGAGLCRQTIVPSELVTSGGITGTAGTCSRILQCGTSAQYVVTQFNVGSGC